MSEPDDLTARCQLCGEPMPAGEEMFQYHGYSGPCPTSPLRGPAATLEAIRLFAREEVTLARLAEILQVNIADVQFLRPLCPAVYRRGEIADE